MDECKPLVSGIKKMVDDTGLSLDGFMALLGALHVVYPRPANEMTEYLRFICTCKNYQRSGKCKHVLCEAIRSQSNFVPQDMMLKPLVPLVDFSAQPEPFLSLQPSNHPSYPAKTADVTLKRGRPR